MTQQDNRAGNLPEFSLNTDLKHVDGEYVTLLGEVFYRIRNYDHLDPFFITLISSSNHWLFISTTGGLTAGRVNSDHALFPYYTVDKITENADNTGSKTIIRVGDNGRTAHWEPFSIRYDGIYHTERNLFKNIPGTVLVFEEINHDLGLTFRYSWRASETYGFVKSSYLINNSQTSRQVDLLDGLQNVLPANVATSAQTQLSNLLDAYKFNELDEATGMGLFSLNSRLTDVAEPSESLRTTTVWHVGLNVRDHLLSSEQIGAFRKGRVLEPEHQVRGRRGAYFIHSQFALAPEKQQAWHLVADVGQDSADVIKLRDMIMRQDVDLVAEMEQDIARGQGQLQKIIALSDGLQLSDDRLSTAHHYANVLFNVMRGGIFANQYTIQVSDLQRYLNVRNRTVTTSFAEVVGSDHEVIQLSDLYKTVRSYGNPDLTRLVTSYLPLTFSRRHGDPSRPWNRFEINVKEADGSRKLDYQGNWRDIFQNWEALSYSFPQFVPAMISEFLNATTVDGYNPYRITRDGIDWEVPEPSNPWSNIGYWNDHQIIYLQKLLEVYDRFYPHELQSLLQQRVFSFADVPYRIKSYQELIADPYDTIIFDWDSQARTEKRVEEIGADGKLVHNADGQIAYASLAEKLFTLLLAKLVNFVPEGGIWLNTQRPEWNDANNALVGKGLSVVTLSYMRRFIRFYINLLETSTIESLTMRVEVIELLQAINSVLHEHHHLLQGTVSDHNRRTILDGLGSAGSQYRTRYYQGGISDVTADIQVDRLVTFLGLALDYVEHALRANKREDNLYHAYNILHLSDGMASVTHLPIMLEGQVAILSSGMLSAHESLALLRTMRQSALYREDQHSYMLYPDREIAGFLGKNNIRSEDVEGIRLINMMRAHADSRLMTVDVNGVYHFNGDIRNARDVQRVLDDLAQESLYRDTVQMEAQTIINLFERVFNHAAFTGRSSTFFAFEGLGSIYWHMVSKLLLAVQETIVDATRSDASASTVEALKLAYDDVRAGLGFNKPPAVYGAFPTDPYSHTPAGRGAKQPGMTGMVKEEILTRLLELGILIEDGCIEFQKTLFRSQELLGEQATFSYKDVNGVAQQIDISPGSLAFTFCQVPFVIQAGNKRQIELALRDGSSVVTDQNRIEASFSADIFARAGTVTRVSIQFNDAD